MTLKECKLSTYDNPYDPFEQFDSWLSFDIEKGHYSSSRLMRIANIDDSMSDEERQIEIERAIDEIIKYDFTNTYKKEVRMYEDTRFDD